MGIHCSYLHFSCCSRHRDARILLLGLDNAGKTTILSKLNTDTHLRMIPTVGFNVETIVLKGFKLNIWDVGGQDKIRPLWRHYYAGTKGLIFVVDSGDSGRLEEAAVELHRVMGDREMKHVVLLIYANKQDQLQMDPGQLTEKLRLTELRPDALWKVQPSCAITGQGLVDGLVWLVDALARSA